MLVEESHSEVHCPCHLRKKIFITTQVQLRLLIVFSTWVEGYNHNTTLYLNGCCNFRIYAKFHKKSYLSLNLWVFHVATSEEAVVHR